MKTYLTDVLKVLIVTVFVTLATSSAQQVSITSVDLSGRMGFALSPTGTVADYACSVEWCSTLGNGWTNAWPHPFASFPLSNGTYSADLPRFFRILCATGTVAPGANAAYKVINSNIVARTQDGLISWTNNGDPKYFVEYAVGTNRVWLGDWVCQTNIHATADVTNHIELPMWFRVVAITQATAIVTLEALVQSYNGAARSVTATTTPTGLPVAITYAGLAWAPTNAGSYAVAATITDSNYTGVTNGILLVNKLSVVLTGVRTYDGTATASNSILSVSNKIGSDDVTVASGSGTLMSSNAGWRAFASLGTLTLGGAAAGNYTTNGASGSVNITAMPATVTLTNLTQIYTNAARAVSATTAPTGLPVAITYAGLAWAPTNAGSYAVVATVSGNYAGVTNGTLLVNPLPVTLHGTRLTNGTTQARFDMPLNVFNRAGTDGTNEVRVASGTGTLSRATVGNVDFLNFGNLTLGGTAAANYTTNGATGSVDITAYSGGEMH